MSQDTKDWDYLDVAARVNLRGPALVGFFKRKEEARKEGRDWNTDVYFELNGYIWDESECKDEEP